MFGIIGGVGPRATVAFYSTLIDLVSSQSTGRLPRLLIYSMGMTAYIENSFLAGNVSEYAPARTQARGLLDEAVTYFLRNATETVVMPCNTLQDELAALCKNRPIDHINMIDETAKAILEANCRRLFVLGTTSTCRDDLYGRRLRQYKIACVYPQAAEQHFIERYIRHALDQKLDADLKARFAQVVHAGAQGCDGVLIACTDLSGDLTPADGCLPVFDSLQLLARASARHILTQKKLFAVDDWGKLA